MEIEADLFLFFTGWTPKDTENMKLAELLDWHDIAAKRSQVAQAKLNQK